jgi:hypothetical protein
MKGRIKNRHKNRPILAAAVALGVGASAQANFSVSPASGLVVVPTGTVSGQEDFTFNVLLDPDGHNDPYYVDSYSLSGFPAGDFSSVTFNAGASTFVPVNSSDIPGSSIRGNTPANIAAINTAVADAQFVGLGDGTYSYTVAVDWHLSAPATTALFDSITLGIFGFEVQGGDLLVGDRGSQSFTLEAVATPEPAQTVAGAMLLGCGGLMFAGRRLMGKASG